MKKNLIFIITPFVLLLVLVWTSAFNFFIPEIENTGSNPDFVYTAAVTENYSINGELPRHTIAKETTSNQNISSVLIDYAQSLIGSPYVYAGINPDGFDCSGFVTHVFDKYGIELPHSSAMQAEEGIGISKSEARPGDLVIFTGTDPDLREPGHVGIVISAPGDTIAFVHASSNGGVKISEVEGTGYERRYLGVRRVL